MPVPAEPSCSTENPGKTWSWGQDQVVNKVQRNRDGRRKESCGNYELKSYAEAAGEIGFQVQSLWKGSPFFASLPVEEG